MTLPQWLLELDIPAKCIDQKTSASEKGRSFVIYPKRDESVWRIKVDQCWLVSNENQKVDYLFWCTNSIVRLCLVELKGKNFKSALNQIEQTLLRLYKLHPPLRQFAAQGGICVYVVLSKGQGVSRRLSEIERLQKKYHVIIRYKSQRYEAKGLEA